MAQPSGMTPFYRFYCGVATMLAPLAWRRVRAKLTAEGIAPARIRERQGHATLPRPEGPLFWFHAASVGESVSVLALVERMLAARPGAQALVTSGTGGAAKVLADRLPERTRHQFAPLDTAAALRRFLRHWRPDAGIFVESELWPQMIVRARAAGTRLALVNARMSKGSLRNWGRFDDTFRFLLDQFDLVRTQDRATLDGLLALGADPARVAQGPNLKAMIAPPPVDATELERLRATLPGPLWAAAATHAGEEEQVLDAHMAARAQIPGLRLLLIPRHPDRAEEIARLVHDRGLGLAQRSKGEAPDGAEVYLADTFGEMGLWYSLAPLAFLGGSLCDAGGHTPYEPACFGTPVLHGPRYANFAETYAAFDGAGAALEVPDAGALGTEVARLLTDEAALTALSEATRALSADQRGGLDAVAQELLDSLAPLSDPAPLV
ncbi:3-deoxy-D-manno-octulosonic acid transferase [Pseudooceanicola marinus]|uniref:3-deoxy-D-manno-octulosonic acid transferase n=1 Tax=Pseudooceanicola marinus TaxID=396013 RepID=A0A1X6ZFF7_9RHOB|nr:3-deoxy-D-manno-octulosonic acid transferase [Pseudooceanicola marinus]PJE28439.1 3-deoxy-D-manno-octulosonic acid transferase [Pseudooceanicola marinus]SLN49692.1 3-deoxy-D-manno-octulosonic acid transferase [Pseudooceanicola marinus]